MASLTSAVGGALSLAVSNTFATELQSCFTFAQRIAQYPVRELATLVEGLGDPAISLLCAGQAQCAMNYLKFTALLAEVQGGGRGRARG